MVHFASWLYRKYQQVAEKASARVAAFPTSRIHAAFPKGY
jgi:hypothetical protein